MNAIIRTPLASRGGLMHFTPMRAASRKCHAVVSISPQDPLVSSLGLCIIERS
jgi:hypothetical protein